MPTARHDTTAAQEAVEQPFADLQPILLRHQSRPEGLIEILHRAQQLYGYLSAELLSHVAHSLGLPLSRVQGTATFYHLFRFQPPALHSCVVCTGTACSVKGADRLVEVLERELQIRLGSACPDRSISLGSVRCLGTCGAAPLVLFDGVVAQKQSVDSVLYALRRLQR